MGTRWGRSRWHRATPAGTPRTAVPLLTCDDGTRRHQPSPSDTFSVGLENRYRFTPVVGSNPTPSALTCRFVLWAFRAARSRWAGLRAACHSRAIAVGSWRRRCTFVDVAGPGRCGCRRLVRQDGGTAGDRRWSSVTALLGDASSTLDRFSSALSTCCWSAASPSTRGRRRSPTFAPTASEDFAWRK
jgi:hypothetical protein